MPRLIAAVIAVVSLLVPPFTASASEDTWNTVIDVTIEAAAGEWVYLHHEVPTPHPEQMLALYTYAFRAQAPEDGHAKAFFSPLQPIDVYRDFGELLAPAHSLDPVELVSSLRLKDIPPGGNVTLERTEFPSYFDNATPQAFTLLVGADVPWTLHLRLEYIDGWTRASRPTPRTVEPTLLVKGNNASFWRFDETTTPAPLPEYTYGTLTGTFHVSTPGWTHVELDWERAPGPWLALREHSASFPNGFRMVGPTIHTAQTLNRADPSMTRGFGTMENVPGDVAFTVQRADKMRNLSALAVHIPIQREQFPPRLHLWDYGCTQPESSVNWTSRGGTAGGCWDWPAKLAIPLPTL